MEEVKRRERDQPSMQPCPRRICTPRTGFQPLSRPEQPIHKGRMYMYRLPGEIFRAFASLHAADPPSLHDWGGVMGTRPDCNSRPHLIWVSFYPMLKGQVIQCSVQVVSFIDWLFTL
jgi:hypothetical protein